MDVKPCPWCGETSGEVVETSTFRWRAWACGCGVVGPEIRIQTRGDGTPAEWEAEAEIRAVEAWNDRAADKSSACANPGAAPAAEPSGGG